MYISRYTQTQKTQIVIHIPITDGTNSVSISSLRRSHSYLPLISPLFYKEMILE